MSNIYFYPKIDYRNSESPNPYIFNLENSLSQKHNIVNYKYNKIGVLDFFRYLFKADVYLFNWLEDLPSLRYGKLQVLTFVLFTFLSNLLGIKIWWILHNKYSHDVRKNKWTDFMYKLLIKKSDLIITHSKGGIEFIKENHPLYLSKIKYIIHPIVEILPEWQSEEKSFDFLIWGSIFPYKGLLQFLKYINDNYSFQNIKILIVGRCFDNEYKKEINKNLSKNIIHYDKLYDFKEIADFSRKAKFTLFTHNSKSVLSSGALMDSIRMRSLIIGPNIGSFKDLSSYSFIYTYDNYDDIINIYENYQFYNNSNNNRELEDFCKENSWDLFAEKLNIAEGHISV